MTPSLPLAQPLSVSFAPSDSLALTITDSHLFHSPTTSLVAHNNSSLTQSLIHVTTHSVTNSFSKRHWDSLEDRQNERQTERKTDRNWILSSKECSSIRVKVNTKRICRYFLTHLPAKSNKRKYLIQDSSFIVVHLSFVGALYWPYLSPWLSSSLGLSYLPMHVKLKD